MNPDFPELYEKIRHALPDVVAIYVFGSQAVGVALSETQPSCDARDSGAALERFSCVCRRDDEG